jgi:hypothetical protein
MSLRQFILFALFVGGIFAIWYIITQNSGQFTHWNPTPPRISVPSIGN